MTYIIQTNDVSKHYSGDLRAVDQISLRIKKGEIYGFIGLNGAGKTTVIRLLLGMQRPTEGSCYINGKQVNRKNKHVFEHVGYMVETPYAYPELTVKENLDIIRRLRLLDDQQVVRAVIDKLDLTAYENIKASKLSLGNAQRLGIAKALLHKPDLLILDEPMNGLDPAGIVEIRELLQDLAFNHGVTIFISSHILGEVAKIATTIGVIHKGKLIQEVQSEKLKTHLNQRLLLSSNDTDKAQSILSVAGYPSEVNQEGLIGIYHRKAIAHPDQIAKLLVYKGLPPTRLTVEEEDLETYFLRVIRSKGENKL